MGCALRSGWALGGAGPEGGRLTCAPSPQYAGINPLDQVNSEVSGPQGQVFSPCSARCPTASGPAEAFLWAWGDFAAYLLG